MARIAYIVDDRDDLTLYETFESDAAERFTGEAGSDGLVTEELYRTDSRQWVLNLVTGNGMAVVYRLVTANRAKTWLENNGYREAKSRYFDREGKAGRPSKGERVAVRIPTKQLDYAEAMAEEWKVPLAEAVARLAILGIAHYRMSRWFDRDNDLAAGIVQARQGATRDLGDFSGYLDN
jgi:hypothetical protein